jgi:hypothetical protein
LVLAIRFGNELLDVPKIEVADPRDRDDLAAMTAVVPEPPF